MRKAHLHFIDIEDLSTVKKSSQHVISLNSEATEVDLMEQISILENKKRMVCDDWSWLSSKSA